jgi:hypothetical protein
MEDSKKKQQPRQEPWLLFPFYDHSHTVTAKPPLIDTIQFSMTMP